MNNIWFVVGYKKTVTVDRDVRAVGLQEGSALRQSMWDLLGTKWHWDGFFSEFFGFSPSVSFHHYSVLTHVLSMGCTVDLLPTAVP
jgi:hypothetical protein